MACIVHSYSIRITAWLKPWESQNLHMEKSQVGYLITVRLFFPLSLSLSCAAAIPLCPPTGAMDGGSKTRDCLQGTDGCISSPCKEWTTGRQGEGMQWCVRGGAATLLRLAAWSRRLEATRSSRPYIPAMAIMVPDLFYAFVLFLSQVDQAIGRVGTAYKRMFYDVFEFCILHLFILIFWWILFLSGVACPLHIGAYKGGE